MKGLIKLLQLCCLYLKLVRPADVISPINCEIQNVAGFLQYVCPNSTHAPGFGSTNVEPRTFKCVNTDQLYRVGVWFAGGRSNAVGIVSHRCEKDPNFYQACSLRDLFNILNIDDSFTAEIHSGNFSCGYLCEIDDFVMGRMIFGIPNVKRRSYGSSGVSGNINRRFVCDGVKNCLNTDLDESQCGDSSNDHRCDLKCDVYPECLDESSCNGYNYGLWCENGTKYVRPFMVCDGSAWCSDWSDERACRVDDKVEFTCMSAITGAIIPLFNYTRCRPIAEYNFFSTLNVMSYCTDYLDQTNCSDYSRVGLYCLVKCMISTIAHQVICFKENLYSTRLKIPSICDDGLDKACVDASLSCYLHKHLLCDGEVNCEDLSDESWYFCHHMTEVTCRRKYVHGTSGRSIAYPMAWIQDGVTDCWNGEDEDETWPTCGYGPTSRFVSWANEVCSEVFLCPKSDLFVEFDKMCDRIESCGNENQICEKSRHQFSTYQNVFRDNSNRVRLSYCLHGLKNLERLADQCVEKHLVLSNTTILGKNETLNILFPETKRDCRYFYGESHVLLSCLGKCHDSPCPVRKRPQIRFDSCPGQFEQNKVFSTDSLGSMTILIKNAKTGLLGNYIFACRSSPICLTYDKVCNLVDDCGDESDEVSCVNHFQCETSKEFIPISQKCDRIFHCADKSDECNESCGGTIINGGVGLKVMAWIIGVLSLVLNLVCLLKTSVRVLNCKSEAAFFTNCLVVLISFGDFLTGAYLTALASFDRYYGGEHCKLNLDWLVSTVCMLLGVVNSIGSQISLFSMTALSVIRAHGTLKSYFQISNAVSKRSVFKISIISFFIILLCFLISYIPLLAVFEDYFVNGIKYENTLFLGCPGKNQHMTVLEKYYGRMRLAEGLLSWSQIREMTGSMFSNDYGGIKQTTLSFYGNDPVCVFKFFVDVADPQRNFSFAIISLNCICFVVIAGSYVAISATSRKSVRSLTNGTNEQNSAIQKTDARLQRVVLSLIISDFLCWIPFIIICWLHMFGVVDGNPWYRIFAILVLPINAVVNPVLYDKSTTRAIDVVVLWAVSQIRKILKKPIEIVEPAFELKNIVKNALANEAEKKVR